jgi:hypothetical protein
MRRDTTPTQTRKLFYCDCGNLCHHFVIEREESGDDVIDSFLSIRVKLNERLGFFGRLKVAFCYLFKRGDSSFPYEEVLLSLTDTETLGESLLAHVQRFES